MLLAVFVGSLAFPALFAGLIAASGYNAALLTVAAATFATGIYVYARLRRPPQNNPPPPCRRGAGGSIPRVGTTLHLTHLLQHPPYPGSPSAQ